jgi:hypothetical protein
MPHRNKLIYNWLFFFGSHMYIVKYHFHMFTWDVSIDRHTLFLYTMRWCFRFLCLISICYRVVPFILVCFYHPASLVSNGPVFLLFLKYNVKWKWERGYRNPSRSFSSLFICPNLYYNESKSRSNLISISHICKSYGSKTLYDLTPISS